MDCSDQYPAGLEEVCCVRRLDWLNYPRTARTSPPTIWTPTQSCHQKRIASHWFRGHTAPHALFEVCVESQGIAFADASTALPSAVLHEHHDFTNRYQAMTETMIY